ncbi:MAG: glycoside hydrolase family 130 protein [Pseudolysinimonas sp.]
MTALLRDAGVELLPDASRIVARLFLPGEGLLPKRSRAGDIVRRIRSTPPAQLEAEAEQILDGFAHRHRDLIGILAAHAETVAFRTELPDNPDPALAIVLGAAFTLEYSVEAAALCNPSAVVHPDQSGLQRGELRLAVALRAIGEGHISSVGFVSAVVGGGRWRFEPRERPVVQGDIGEGEWIHEAFSDALESVGQQNELSAAILRALPESFRSGQIEDAIHATPAELSRRPDAHVDLDIIRTLAWSAYTATFPADVPLSARVLMPATPSESNGMEDARFVRFTADDGKVDYRATYTAFNGLTIGPRMIVSDDLQDFAMYNLFGTAAQNKGMAFFPRTINGTHWALTRTDGENISLARSDDGIAWDDFAVLVRPGRLWEVVQTGNSGSPLETDGGWLVLTHGVGPMRQYAIGAMLLDLDDPTTVLARLDAPLLGAGDEQREGYVPNVVYSCGGIIHDGTLWLPYGVGDQRVRAGSIGVTELLDAMTPVGPAISR